MARKKTNLEDRLNAAHTQSLGALDLFEKAALTLETSAAEQQAVAKEAEARASHFNNVVRQASDGAAVAVKRAQNIRNLIGA
jgi:hypothetical protein